MAILSPPGTNPKLGPGVVSWSRPVGPTCPSSCPFLTGIRPDGSLLPAEGLCYADRVERADAGVRAVWAGNLSADWGPWSRQLRAELEEAARAGYAVRIHVGGDFLRPDGHLDRAYVAAVLRAFRAARPRPAAWCYTHAWREMADHRDYFEAAGIEMFASVHGHAEAYEAKYYYDWARVAYDGGDKPDHYGAFNYMGMLNCPEQRLGADKITCTTCKWCFRPGRGDVVFYLHGPGTKNYTPGAKHHE